MRTHPLRFNLVLVLTCLLAILLFLLGLAGAGTHVSGRYLLPIMIVFLWGRRRDIYIITTVASVLSVAGYWMEGPVGLGEVLFDHLLYILVLWMAAWLLAERRQAQDQMERREQVLGEQVKARTAELQASEQRYRLLAENNTDLVWALDLDGQITYLSPAIQRLSGYTPQEVEQMTWEQHLPPEFAAHGNAQLQTVLAAVRAGRPLNGDPYIAPELRKDGTIVWTETVCGVLHDDAGHVIGLCGTTRDITERKQAEEARRQSQEQLAKIFHSNPGGIGIVRMSDGCFLEANGALLAITGYTREQFIGHSAVELGIMTAAERASLVATALRQGYVRGMDTQIVDAHGHVVDVFFSIELVDFAGEPCLLLLVIDVTAHRQLENLLAASERRYRDLYDNSPDMYFVGSVWDETIVDCNQTLAHTLGYTKEELIGRRGDILYEPSAYAAVLANRAEFLAAGNWKNFEAQLRCKEGTLVDVLVSAVVEPEWAGDQPAARITLRNVTERKAAERALRASEDRFVRLFSSSPVGLTLTHFTGDRHLEANDAFLAMIGYSRDELLGRTSLDLGIIAHADYARLAAIRQAEGELHGVDLVLHTKCGQQLHTLVSIEVVESAGEPCVLSSIVDITARKQLEDALAASERKYRSIFDNSPDMYMSGYPDQLILDCNLTVTRILGYTREELIGQPNSMVLTPASHNRMLAELPQYLAAGGYSNLQVQLQRKDGTILDALLSSYLEPATAEHPDISHVTLRDVTAHKRLENQMRDAFQRLQLATEAAGIGIWTWDIVDGSLEWDERMCELHAVTPEERRAGISDDLWRSRIHPDDLALADPAQGDLSRLGRQWAGAYRIVLPGGAVRHIQANALVEYEPNGQPRRIIGINRDISDQVAYDRLLQDTNAVLEQRVIERTAELQSALSHLRRANRLKDEFMAMISHELRTPLTGVLTLSELLADEIGGPLSTRQAAYVKGIMESGERLLAVVNAILSYTHLLGGKVELNAELCNLANLLAICAASQQHKAAAKGQSIAVDVQPPDLAITADPTALAEVLKRLLDNAVKFTPAGGRIGLEAHPGATPGTSDLLVGVDLAVWDTGIGIPPDQVDQIFHAFTQADARLARSHEGIGIGLAYADQMVRLMGGTIKVDSTPGEGSRFIVTLPA